MSSLASCDDGNACTRDYYNINCSGCFCVNEPRVCNDGDKCTNDSCNPNTGGCVFQPKNCNDGDICTADSCNPTTGACENPRYCSDTKCCPAGASRFCCNVGEDICCPANPAFPYHCCRPGETCCGAGCCLPEQTCCNDQCGTKGACCFFDTGSCSEKTSLCCLQAGGTYQGDGTTCSPPDLCRPICENCHAVNGVFLECLHHWPGPLEPCDQNACIRNIMDTASCDFFPHRLGLPKCNTSDTGCAARWCKRSMTLRSR